MRWWTADLHFGHANIIRYCDRPFSSVEEMDEGLIERWNDAVGEGDEVWVLGDFAMGGLAEHVPLAKRLAGHKVLVAGNHDACWEGRSKGDFVRWTAEYLEAGFERIVQPPSNALLGGTTVLVHHFPYHGDSREDVERFADHRPADEGSWLLHGHVHDRWRQADRQINVGVDAWGGRPVGDDEVARLIAAGPAEHPPLPWV
jgi:calcineurin-like phosphoesterase family protein